ncbi:MAG: DUF4286 family protein [Bacteroidales bacterium]|nr:DUF4286 family protein [Bacteroidales bacterium]
MIRVNTTFVVHEGVEEPFLQWLRGDYVAGALESGVFNAPSLSRLLMALEPATVSYALQMEAPSLDEAQSWIDNVAPQLMSPLLREHGTADRILWFTSYMEVLEL